MPALSSSTPKKSKRVENEYISGSLSPNPVRQKARKSFPSSLKASPIKKVLLPPSQIPPAGFPQFGGKTQKMTLLHSVPALPSFTLPKTTVSNLQGNASLFNTLSGITVLGGPNPAINSLVKMPGVAPGSNVQLLSQGGKVTLDTSGTASATTISGVGGQILQKQIVMPPIPHRVGAQPQQSLLQSPLLSASKMLLKAPGGLPSSTQEFLVQQQTPDGQQKTFKLIKLPANHPLANTVKPTNQQTSGSQSQSNQPVVFSNANLPPGIIIMKNNSTLPHNLTMHNVLQNTPARLNMPSSATSSPAPSSLLKASTSRPEEVDLPDDDDPVGMCSIIFNLKLSLYLLLPDKKIL